MTRTEIAKVEALAEVYRERLHGLSWFMRTLDEHIARRANAEDGVKGRFRYVSTVGRDERVIRAYIRHQEAEDQRFEQLNLSS